MKEQEYKEFEKAVLTLLKQLDFKVVSYYAYPHYVDIVAYIKPPQPLTIPTRLMVEIVKGKPTEGMIESFIKLSRDSLSEKMIIFSPVPKTSLDEKAISFLEKSKLEFLDIKQVAEIISKKKSISATEMKKIYNVYSPPMLARHLSEISLQKIPKEIESTVNDLGLKPWQVFEQVVFSIFHYCFGFVVRKLGEDSLFKHEPEGVAVMNKSPPVALVYECKSAEQSYKMTAQDELTYKDYIRKKKEVVPILEKANLEYFLIISPEFAGDLEKRRENIFRQTKVLPVFMTAENLSKMGIWACTLPNDIKRLIDLSEVFTLKETIVTSKSIERYISTFEDETKNRY